MKTLVGSIPEVTASSETSAGGQWRPVGLGPRRPRSGPREFSALCRPRPGGPRPPSVRWAEKEKGGRETGLRRGRPALDPGPRSAHE